MTTTTHEMELTHFTFSVEESGVAVVMMDRSGAAMNTLSPELAADLGQIITRVESDPSIIALVIGSAKQDNFLAGADIAWLRSLTDEATATEASVAGQLGFDRLEALHRDLGKPVVAAIHGACLGGGLELALACSIRICTDDAKTVLGQPEIQLGLIPGGGGTQRLPRLIGLTAGLDLILSGRNVRPRKAKSLGMVDEVVPKQALHTVMVRRALEAALAGRTGSADGQHEGATARMQRLALEANAAGRKVVFDRAAKQVAQKTRGNYPAPVAAIEVIKLGYEQGIEAGYAAEALRFGDLVVSAEAKALMSIFFASQAVKKDSGVDDPTVEAHPVRKVGVLGGGLMGGGIAAVTAVQAGIPVRIKEVDDAGIGRGLAYVQRFVDGRVKRHRLSRREARRTMHTVTGTVDYSGFGPVDLVIEAVFEDLALKRSILQQVEGVTGEETIFASNTSSIPIADIAAAAGRPGNVIGMHYFSPVEKMPLLEIIVTDQTADWVTATCVQFGKRQGKTVIVVNDGTGFYTTRILGPYLNETGYLLEEGVPVEEIDTAMVDWGFPVGPLVLVDEVGIDVGVKIAAIMVDAFGDRMVAPENLARVLEDDRKGRKNQRGFYLYEKGKKLGVDETIYEIIGTPTPGVVPRPEIQDRMALSMANEAVRCLEEGILRSARDGDIGAVFGLGFPPFTGGPFSFLDRIGAERAVARLEYFADKYGSRFEPAALLREHAATGTRFRS